MTTTTPEFVYDPSTAAFQEELWSVYRTMRDHYPVYRNPNTRAFALSRFDDVWQVVHDPETYSNYSEDADTLLPQISFMDAPRHTALRALVSRAFTPARVAEIELLARETARRLCDHIEPRGECDLQHDFAAILPSVIIARMIGVDDEHVMSFREWTEGFVEITSPEDFAEPAAKIYALFAEVLAERHARPRADMMTALIDAEIDGEHLTDEERLGFCMNLILGGNDTTSSLIGSGMVHLAENPDQRRLLLEDSSL